MQHGHGRTAWARACSMSMGMQHGHEHAAWTGTCSMDMDMQHGHGYAARTCMDMQHWHMHAAWTRACSMDTGMQHEHGHAAWTWTCSMGMAMMLGDHRSIVALFKAFDSTFSLFLQCFPRKGRQWWPLWPSPPPASLARTVSWYFYYKDNAFFLLNTFIAFNVMVCTIHNKYILIARSMRRHFCKIGSAAIMRLHIKTGLCRPVQ